MPTNCETCSFRALEIERLQAAVRLLTASLKEYRDDAHNAELDIDKVLRHADAVIRT